MFVTVWRSILSVFLLAIAVGTVYATAFQPKDFGQMVSEAEQIFIGTVTGIQAHKLGTGAIVSQVSFGNLQIIKGPIAETITLQMLGGTVDGETLRVAGLPTFHGGVRYLVFMAGNGSAIFPVVGGPQGVFQVQLDPTTGQDVVVGGSGAPVQDPSLVPPRSAQGANPSEATPVTPVPIPLNTFLQEIRNRL